MCFKRKIVKEEKIQFQPAKKPKFEQWKIENIGKLRIKITKSPPHEFSKSKNIKKMHILEIFTEAELKNLRNKFRANYKSKNVKGIHISQVFTEAELRNLRNKFRKNRMKKELEMSKRTRCEVQRPNYEGEKGAPKSGSCHSYTSIHHSNKTQWSWVQTTVKEPKTPLKNDPVSIFTMPKLLSPLPSTPIHRVDWYCPKKLKMTPHKVASYHFGTVPKLLSPLPKTPCKRTQFDFSSGTKVSSTMLTPIKLSTCEFFKIPNLLSPLPVTPLRTTQPDFATPSKRPRLNFSIDQKIPLLEMTLRESATFDFFKIPKMMSPLPVTPKPKVQSSIKDPSTPLKSDPVAIFTVPKLLSPLPGTPLHKVSWVDADKHPKMTKSCSKKLQMTPQKMSYFDFATDSPLSQIKVNNGFEFFKIPKMMSPLPETPLKTSRSHFVKDQNISRNHLDFFTLPILLSPLPKTPTKYKNQIQAWKPRNIINSI